MTAADLRELFEYHYWARDRLLDALETLSPEEYVKDRGSSFRSIHDTAVHIYSAEWAWYRRWMGESPTAHLRPEDLPDVDRLRRVWSRLQGDVRRFLDTLDDTSITQVRAYRLFSGAEGSSPLCEMALHVVNHASYHRGQITTMLRQAGAAPPKSMDMIGFYREKTGLVRPWGNEAMAGRPD